MNVKELIEKLQQFPEDMEVQIHKGYDPEFGEDYYVQLNDFEEVDGKVVT